MNVSEVTTALCLPSSARVDRRIPKTLLIEHGSPTAADKRRIQEGVDEIQWLAALKPTTVGVPSYRDDVREYLEIAVLSATLRNGSKADRLCELIHRAVPYPVFLIATEGICVRLSLAHKRRSQGDSTAIVLDGEPITAEFDESPPDKFEVELCNELALTRQPRVNLYALYQGWVDSLLALHAARVTGAFTAAPSPEQATARREALAECARLDAEIERLRAAAAKEKQISKQVELNLALKRAEADRANAFAKL